MYCNEYTVRDYAAQDKFFKQPSIEVVVDFGRFKESGPLCSGWPEQRICSIGVAANVMVTFSGCLDSIAVFKEATPEELKDIAKHIEHAGGRLFTGNKRIYGSDNKRKRKPAPADI